LKLIKKAEDGPAREEDLTGALDPRLMSLSLADNRGMEADQLDVTLSDADGKLDIPIRGVKLHLFLGWDDSGLVDKGIYTVDEIEYSGTPDQLTLRARSADLREGLATKKERSWHATTAGSIVKKIARENGLEPAVSGELEKEPVAHLDQQNESDANLLTRLSEMFDAVAAVKSGHLLFFRIGRGKSLSGKDFPVVRITRAEGDRHRFSVADREGCESVSAAYYDRATGKKQKVILRMEDLDIADRRTHLKKIPPRLAVSARDTRALRHTYASRLNALRACRGELRKAKRGIATFAITLARGRPDIVPEYPVTVSGWKPAIDEADWLIRRVAHHLSGSGLTTELELELRPGEPNENDLKKDKK
jgi:phage protein D